MPAIRADGTGSGDRAALRDQVAARFGRIDIPVNNARVLIERDAMDTGDPCDGLDREATPNRIALVAVTAAVLHR